MSASSSPELRCAPWTLAEGIDPIGSATAFDALLLVEWPLPWPSDISEIEELAPATGHGGATVMTVVPQSLDGPTRIVHRRRVGPHELAGVDHLVERDDVPALLATLLEAPLDDSASLPSAAGPAPAEVLVCGHGRRDPCCGRWGTLLHAELEGEDPDVRVWRCSHTGGHRFAPTAITLPDGRTWAYADALLLQGVVRRAGDHAALRPHDRGTSALPSWAQVVERAVFDHLGWPWLDIASLESHVEVADDGRSARVTLTWPDGRAEGTVTVARQYPVLVCGQPVEAARKSASELALEAFTIS